MHCTGEVRTQVIGSIFSGMDSSVLPHNDHIIISHGSSECTFRVCTVGAVSSTVYSVQCTVYSTAGHAPAARVGADTAQQWLGGWPACCMSVGHDTACW